MNKSHVPEAELVATIARLEGRLSLAKGPEVESLMRHYAGLVPRFEADLTASNRDIALAKASALMLVQAVALAQEFDLTQRLDGPTARLSGTLVAMNIGRVHSPELSSVHELLVRNGWAERLGSVEQFSQLVEASQVADITTVDNQVVGFVRAITDGHSNGYLSMLVVAPEYRRKGVGRELVRHALGSNARVTWVLRAGREGAAEFFAKLGFEHSSLAMERRREQSR